MTFQLWTALFYLTSTYQKLHPGQWERCRILPLCSRSSPLNWGQTCDKLTGNRKQVHPPSHSPLLALPFSATDNFPCHFVSAFGAGLCATVVASPVDVVKTRYINSPPGQYRSPLDCMLKMVAREGPTALYKGWASPSCLQTPSQETQDLSLPPLASLSLPSSLSFFLSSLPSFHLFFPFFSF